LSTWAVEEVMPLGVTELSCRPLVSACSLEIRSYVLAVLNLRLVMSIDDVIS
jgi:hypothetical protein